MIIFLGETVVRGPDLFFQGHNNFRQDGCEERAIPLIYYVKFLFWPIKSILRADTQKKTQGGLPPTSFLKIPLQWQQMKFPTAQHVTSASRRRPTRRGSRQSRTALVVGIQQALHTFLASPYTPNKNARMSETERMVS